MRKHDTTDDQGQDNDDRDGADHSTRDVGQTRRADEISVIAEV
jgi:hypothetical protein